VRWAGFSTDQSKIRAEASTMIRTRWIFGLTAALLPLLLMSASISEGRFVGMRFDNGVLIPNPPPYDPNNPNTGLQKAFPTEIVQPADNPTTPEKVELGKLLFFDPILSDDNTLSCAHCHHPHLGFSDGLPRSRGRGGKGAGRERTGGIELTRGAPSLWNTVYNHRQFWDGRAAHLEEQARMVITTPEEVNADPAELVRELKAIPEYRALFDKAFGGKDGEAITFKNITYAIAAFQRTLVSFNSRFDRYAAGDGSALSPQEKRGLKLFLSPKTRCNECHGIPTFANRDFKVIGVPDPKDGPADVAKPEAERGRGGGPNGAFKIPTLRNIALTAPYMHNGAFETLEEVLDFYSGGGGRGLGLDVPLQDDKIRKFALTPQEKADLIAFLLALTDESALPQVPKRVPSGLPVVQPQVPRLPTRLNLNSPELRRIQQMQRRAENTSSRQRAHANPSSPRPSPPLARGERAAGVGGFAWGEPQAVQHSPRPHRGGAPWREHPGSRRQGGTQRRRAHLPRYLPRECAGHPSRRDHRGRHPQRQATRAGRAQSPARRDFGAGQRLQGDEPRNPQLSGQRRRGA
jgi:cytochrome c peroxidase